MEGRPAPVLRAEPLDLKLARVWQKIRRGLGCGIYIHLVEHE
jgi:hypothetical protein